MITKKPFDVYEGKKVHIYTIDNGEIKAGVLDFGGILAFLEVNGQNVCLGYDNVKSYLTYPNYCGATVGRVANRIKNSVYALNGVQCKLSANEGETCLHGGKVGFSKRFFEAEEDGDTLTLSLVSEDGDMGFAGELHFKVRFSLSGRTLRITYTGESNKDTVFSPTCHAYFNLDGDVYNTQLYVNADYYTPTDEKLIPTGERATVKDTPLDFTVPKSIGRDIGAFGGGTYDHNFCLNGNPAAVAKSEVTGLKMTLSTDMPGVQLYVGECKKVNGKGGGFGFCLEPQYFPNAVNVVGFEFPHLPANTSKTYYAEYSFDW